MYNSRHKSWNTCVIFPFPQQCLFGYCSHLSAPKYAWLNIGEGEGHIWVRTKVRRVNVRKFQGKRVLFQRFVTSRAVFVWPWNENALTKQRKQTNGNRAIWLVYRTDSDARGFWLVKRTLEWKNFMPENFLEINRYSALTSYCNTTGRSNNTFFI